MSDQIDVNQLSNALQQKVDLPSGKSQADIDYVVEWKAPTSSDKTWYRLYKSGWLEQGGVTETGNNEIITLPKEFADTNYSVQVSRTMLTTSNSDTGGRPYCPEISTMTTTTFRVNQQNGTNMHTAWEAKGFVAQS